MLIEALETREIEPIESDEGHRITRIERGRVYSLPLEIEQRLIEQGSARPYRIEPQRETR